MARQKIQGEVCLFIPVASTLLCEHVENANSHGTGLTPLVLFLNLYFLYFSLPFPKKLYFYGILFPWNCQLMLSPFLWCEVKVKLLSCVRLFATSWTVAPQAPQSVGSSRQEYWSGLPFPSPGYLPNPRIELRSPTLQVDSLPSEPPGNSWYVVSIFKPDRWRKSCSSLCN